MGEPSLKETGPGPGADPGIGPAPVYKFRPLIFVDICSASPKVCDLLVFFGGIGAILLVWTALLFGRLIL
jgi:hypothetical protein